MKSTYVLLVFIIFYCDLYAKDTYFSILDHIGCIVGRENDFCAGIKENT